MVQNHRSITTFTLPSYVGTFNFYFLPIGNGVYTQNNIILVALIRKCNFFYNEEENQDNAIQIRLILCIRLILLMIIWRFHSSPFFPSISRIQKSLCIHKSQELHYRIIVLHRLMCSDTHNIYFLVHVEPGSSVWGEILNTVVQNPLYPKLLVLSLEAQLLVQVVYNN